MPEAAPTDPNDIIRRVAEAGMGIRFGRGVVAKTGYAIIVVLGIWLAIVFRLGASLTLNLFLIGVGLVATCLGIWWVRATQSFAERNPAQAMLDGAEFLEYQRFEAQVKGDAPLAVRGLPAGPMIEAQAQSNG